MSITSDTLEDSYGESVLTADLIHIHIRENRSSAEGQVRMKMVKRD